MEPQLISLDVLIIDHDIQVRNLLDPKLVEKYRECLEHLPPVEVYDTEDGLLLTDGFHRLAAHKLEGHTFIPALVYKGDRTAATEAAIRGNLTHGKPLTSDELHQAVLRMHHLYPDLAGDQLASRLGAVARSTVYRALKAETVGDKIAPLSLPSSVRAIIGTRPEEEWAPLAEAAQKRKWSRVLMQQVVNNLNSEKITPDYKQALLGGGVDPLYVENTNGVASVNPTALGRQLRSAKEASIPMAVAQMLAAIANLEARGTPEEIAEALYEYGSLPELTDPLQNATSFIRRLSYLASEARSTPPRLVQEVH